MALTSDLISELVKVTSDTSKDTSPVSINGTVVIYGGKTYVKLDGSDLLTPVSTTTDATDDDRVIVSVGNHMAVITGNLSSPSAKKESVDDVADQITKFDIVMSYKVTTDNLEAVNATLEALTAKVARVENAEIVLAEIETLQAKYADLEYVKAEDIAALNADIESLQAKFADFDNVTAEDLEAMNADITNLKSYNAEFTYVSADMLSALNATIKDLDANKLSAESADLKYAQIDFANIDEVAVEKLFTESGIIRDLVMSEGHVTGKLVGVTISGDLIEGNTIKADKLVVLGNDGVYYKLNVNALGETTVNDMTPEEQAKLQNGLHGSAIVAKTITAEKIKVDDLVAFGATIGGFHIGANSIYSGAKSSVNNTTRGIFMDTNGQIAFGDSNNYMKYYQDPSDNQWKMEFRASQVIMGGSGKPLEEELEEIKDNVTCNLRIESSRGTVFKNNNVSTVLSAVIFRGAERITDISALRTAMGSSAYLQWKWQRLDDETFGVISSGDSHIGNDGFTYTISADEIDTKVTFLCELIV